MQFISCYKSCELLVEQLMGPLDASEVTVVVRVALEVEWQAERPPPGLAPAGDSQSSLRGSRIV